MKGTGRKNGGRDASLWLLANHDFRQPAQSLELLSRGLRNVGSTADLGPYCDSLAALASSLTAMIEGMSLVARLEAGTTKADQSTVDLAAVSAAGKAELEAAAVLAQGRFTGPGPGGVALADAALVAAVVRGSLLFAAKFCETGDIELAGRSGGAAVTLSLTFAGVLPDGALAEMAFVELAPGGSPGARPLTGLGPALASRVMAQMGGSLSIDTPSTGTMRMTLSLPAA